MNRRKKGLPISGWVNLDKPSGLTSTQALGRVKRIVQPQKAGHAGTLDPLATGILPIALGEATKTIPYAQDAIKTYSFTVRWGEARTTDDAEGDVTASSGVRPDRAQIEAVLPRFVGLITQIPPAFSAIKIDGQRAYDLARAGEILEMKPRQVFIQSLKIVSEGTDFAEFRAVCGKGTYMRSLGRDIALALGTVGYVAVLRREAVGAFTLETAISLEKLEELSHIARLDDALLPVQTVLADIPALALNDNEAVQLKRGQKLAFFSRPDLERLEKAGLELGNGEKTAVAYWQGTPLAIVTADGPEIRPVRLLNL